MFLLFYVASMANEVSETPKAFNSLYLLPSSSLFIKSILKSFYSNSAYVPYPGFLIFNIK